MNYEKQIKKITDDIVNRFQPEKIILFGSYAWGEPGPNSDIDLFIIKAAGDTRQLAREIDGFLFPRPFPIDLLVYHPDQVKKRQRMHDFFIEEILHKGKVLYAR